MLLFLAKCQRSTHKIVATPIEHCVCVFIESPSKYSLNIYIAASVVRFALISRGVKCPQSSALISGAKLGMFDFRLTEIDQVYFGH